MPSASVNDQLIDRFDEHIGGLYARTQESAPNFGVTIELFRASIRRTLGKFLQASDAPASDAEIAEFLDQLQTEDLFLAIGCSNGNERAWWEFDHQHRAHLERVARQLAKTDIDAQEVIDCVYVELYGTRVVNGERISKFSTYSGRGSLRGWLRTVIWHALVDLHRASHDEVSLDEMTETVGEGVAHASFAEDAPGGEDEVIDQITRNRYRLTTLKSIEAAFGLLENHEKLLLLYYHVDQLKLREIARLAENEKSPLRGWFQRKLQSREKNPGGRIHESTIMRWLEKSYARVFQLFNAELTQNHDLNPAEIEICLELATQGLTGENLFSNLKTETVSEKL
jgi:RNA polymerase sigma-70 factor